MQMTPKWKIFAKPLLKIFRGKRIHVLWPNLVGNYQKVILFTAQKTAPWDLSECPIFPQWADRAQNFVNVVAP